MEMQNVGRFIVADPAICQGQLTFRGTRIWVADILEQVALGMDWDAIIEAWRGSISKEAIAEAIRLARDAMVTHLQENSPESADVWIFLMKTFLMISVPYCAVGTYPSCFSSNLFHSGSWFFLKIFLPQELLHRLLGCRRIWSCEFHPTIIKKPAIQI